MGEAGGHALQLVAGVEPGPCEEVNLPLRMRLPEAKGEEGFRMFDPVPGGEGVPEKGDAAFAGLAGIGILDVVPAAPGILMVMPLEPAHAHFGIVQGVILFYMG